MQLTVTIDVDNESFQPEQGTETARILRKLSDRIDGCLLDVGTDTLQDVNGNTVGSAIVSE
jgi:hypothetical protein